MSINTMTEQEKNKEVIKRTVKLKADHFDSIEYESEGGEGKVYEINNNIVKIFNAKAVNMDNKGKKICRLIKFSLDINKDNRFSLPLQLIIKNVKTFDKVTGIARESAVPVGYSMKKIEGKELALLNSKRACKEYNVDVKKLLQTLLMIKYDIHLLHEHGIVIGDLNERNILFDKNLVPYIIDCDSWAIGELPCEVIMPNYRDPLVKGNNFNRESDNFAFMILAFKLLTRMHPFGGTHPNPKFKDMMPEERIKYHAHILIPGAGLTKNVRNFNILSDEMINCFKDFFEGRRRNIGHELENFYANLRICKGCGEIFWRGRGDCPSCKSSNVEDIKTEFDPNKIYKGVKFTDENYVAPKDEIASQVTYKFEIKDIVNDAKFLSDFQNINNEFVYMKDNNVFKLNENDISSPLFDNNENLPELKSIKNIMSLTDANKVNIIVSVQSNNTINIKTPNKTFVFENIQETADGKPLITQVAKDKFVYITTNNEVILVTPSIMKNDIKRLFIIQQPVTPKDIVIIKQDILAILCVLNSTSTAVVYRFSFKHNKLLTNEYEIDINTKNVKFLYNNSLLFIGNIIKNHLNNFRQLFILPFTNTNTILTSRDKSFNEIFDLESFENIAIGENGKIFIPENNQIKLAKITNNGVLRTKIFKCDGMKPLYKLFVDKNEQLRFMDKTNNRFCKLDLVKEVKGE